MRFLFCFPFHFCAGNRTVINIITETTQTMGVLRRYFINGVLFYSPAVLISGHVCGGGGGGDAEVSI